MTGHAGEVWKTRALDAENALAIALTELKVVRGRLHALEYALNVAAGIEER